VTLLDRQEGEVLTGPGQAGWPAAVYAAGLGEGALVRTTAEAPREWKATGLVGPVWMGTSLNGVEVSAVGPVAVPGGASVALRRPGGVLAILDFNDRGEVTGVDFTKEGVIAAGMSSRILGDISVMPREYLDLNRDGVADLVAITTTTTDQTPGAQATTDTTVLHVFGRNRLGKAFRANEVVLPSVALELGGSLQKTSVIRTRILRFSPLPLTELVTSAPKDQYLPVYLASTNGYQTGWIKVDASALPLKWRAGLAPGVGEDLGAGQQTVRTPMTLGYRKDGPTWVLDLKWAEFSTAARLQSANQLGDVFQNASFIPALTNRSTPSGDGWVERHVVFPISAASRFYRVRY
jgi:hypothetical protein